MYSTAFWTTDYVGMTESCGRVGGMKGFPVVQACVQVTSIPSYETARKSRHSGFVLMKLADDSCVLLRGFELGSLANLFDDNDMTYFRVAFDELVVLYHSWCIRMMRCRFQKAVCESGAAIH